MDLESVLLHQRSRRIGTIIPDVSIREQHTDTMQITDHPVERPIAFAESAVVSDHAYRMPAQLVMDVGFSGNGSLLDIVDTTSFNLSTGASPKDIYQNLRSVQQSAELISIVTGKRTYSNMLIKSISVTTDETTENVLTASITFREVLLSSTLVNPIASTSDMSEGVSTSGVQNSGVKTPVLVNDMTSIF